MTSHFVCDKPRDVYTSVVRFLYRRAQPSVAVHCDYSDCLQCRI